MKLTWGGQSIFIVYSISWNKSVDSSRPFRTQCPIRSCLENLSKSYTENWMYRCFRSSQQQLQQKPKVNQFNLKCKDCATIPSFIISSQESYLHSSEFMRDTRLVLIKRIIQRFCALKRRDKPFSQEYAEEASRYRAPLIKL